MSISSFEGWEPIDLEYWEGTAMPLGRTVGTDTVDPPAKPIVDMRPIDEFSVTHEPEEKLYKHSPYAGEKPSAVEEKLKTLKARRDELKEEMRNLRSYPAEDDYEDGAVLIWHEARSKWGPGLHGVAVKDRDRWYVAGELRGFNWDELVALILGDVHFSDVEVVHPPAADED